MCRQIILLNGPSSSGKSTLAKALQALIRERSREDWEIVSIDDFLEMSSDQTIYEDDVYAISGGLCERIREALRSAPGVIVDHVITSERIFRQLQAACGSVPLRLVRVVCPVEVLREREKERGNRSPGSAEASLAYLYPEDGWDMTVDTHARTAEACAGLIWETLFH